MLRLKPERTRHPSTRAPVYRLARAMAVLLIMMITPGMVWAQTTGQLRGNVVDVDGLPIPYTTVTIASDALIGGPQLQETDANGGYLFVELLPGFYEIIGQKAGFQTVSIAGVQIIVNRTTSQEIEMPIGGAAEVVDVIATRPVVDTENVTVGQVITKEYLERMPTGRTYQQAVNISTGIQRGYDGNPQMAGGSREENIYLLDGANVTDPVAGTFAANFNFDAIEQIEVTLTGFEPEYASSMGGIINLVTESGTNNVSFDTSVFYKNGTWRNKMDPRYTADNQTLSPSAFDTVDSGLTVAAKLSGPIIRDRAWYIISYQLSRTLIRDEGLPQTRDYEGHFVLSKLTLQPNTDHRVSMFLQTSPATAVNDDQLSTLNTPDSQRQQVDGGVVGQIRWQWFPTRNFNLEVQAMFQKNFIEVHSVPCTHRVGTDQKECAADDPEGTIDWETPGRIGLLGAYNSDNPGFFAFDDRYRYQGSTKLTLLGLEDPLGGSHDIRAGGGASLLVWNSLTGYSGNLYYADVTVVPQDPTSTENYYWFEIDGPNSFRTTGQQANAWIQDKWKPLENVTVMYGLRFDHTVMRNDLRQPVIVGNAFAPRMFTSWDPFGKKKTQIAIGYGRFNDTSRLEVAQFASAGGTGLKVYLGEALSNTVSAIAGTGGGYLNNQSMLYSHTPVDNRPETAETMRLPHSDEVALKLGQEIVDNVGIEVNLVGKFVRNVFEYDEMNVLYDEDGSAVIGSRFGDPSFNQYRVRTPADAKRDYFQADLVLKKEPSNDWGGRVAYSYVTSMGTSPSALSGSFANDPQTQYNYGPLNTNAQHMAKGIAFYDLPTEPHTTTVSVFFSYTGGTPIERLYWSDASQDYDLRIRDRSYYWYINPWWEMSAKVGQQIDLRRGKLVIDFQIMNLFNNSAPRNVSSFVYSHNRLLALSRQPGTEIQLGLRYIY